MTRPTTQRVQSKADKDQIREDLDTGANITVDGKRFSVRAGDLTALDERALRRQYGVPFAGLLEELGSSPGLDSIAAVIWLSRYTSGERSLTYDEVAGDLRVDDIDIETTDVGDLGAETNPEA